MGRYYQTNNTEGKFGFAVQSSDDPAIFGMEEEPRVEQVWADNEDVKYRGYVVMED